MSIDPSGQGWHEVADRVFQRRYQPYDVTVSVVVGSDGLAVVDTRCSLAEARELKRDLRQLSAAPVRWVVNTHAHFDHVWGNAEFVAPRQRPGAELWGHRATAAAMAADATDPATLAFKERLRGKSDVWAAAMAELEEVVPDRLVDREHTLDLGDRLVRLRHVGRGHTDGDLLVQIPDADAMLAGDLVEESGAPAFGPDSYPLEWAGTLDALLALDGVGPGTVIVPGHGAPVDTGFVREQRTAIASVAARLTAAHRAGTPLAEVLRDGDWPYSTEGLQHAAARAYARLDDPDAGTAIG
jgi:glyoxylase-like metal-dependent hydrolase (beta-lactamase superfamily II)